MKQETDPKVIEKGKKLKPLVLGNTKLGRALIWHFSMLAIFTCPGRSKLCELICYACGALFKMNELAFKARMWMRWQDDFVKRTTSQIRNSFVRVLRIHVAGDFDDVRYIRKWVQIAQACPATTLYAYTRSWRKKRLRKALLELAAEPNVVLFYSCDRETGQPPADPGIRHAYLATDDHDIPDYLVDLVFRDDPEMYRTNLGLNFICPEERGDRGFHRKDSRRRVTCEQCQLCFSRTNALDRLTKRLRDRALPVLELTPEMEVA